MAQKKPNQSLQSLQLQFMKNFLPTANVSSSGPTRQQRPIVSDSDSDSEDSSHSSPTNRTPINLHQQKSETLQSQLTIESSSSEASDSEEVKQPKAVPFKIPIPDTNMTLVEELRMTIESKNQRKTKGKQEDHVIRKTPLSNVKRSVSDVNRPKTNDITKKKLASPFDSNHNIKTHFDDAGVSPSYTSRRNETGSSKSTKNILTVHCVHPPLPNKPNIVRKPTTPINNNVSKPPPVLNKPGITQSSSAGRIPPRPVVVDEKDKVRKGPAVVSSKAMGPPPPPPPPAAPPMNLAPVSAIPTAIDGRSDLLKDIRNFGSNSRLKKATSNSSAKPSGKSTKPSSKGQSESLLSSLKTKLEVMRPNIEESDCEEDDFSDNESWK